MALYMALIRHGDYDQRAGVPSAWQPWPLNDKGRADALRAVERLQEDCAALGVDLVTDVHASNLLRGWQTAEIICEAWSTTLTPSGHDALAERSVGSAANLTVAEIEQGLAADPRFDAPPADWKSNSHYCLPLQGAESLMQAGHRVADHIRKVIRQLAAQQAEGIKLFVGHGAAFRHAAHILGILEFEDIARLSMYHGEPVVFRLDQGPEPMVFSHVRGQWKVRPPKEERLD